MVGSFPFFSEERVVRRKSQSSVSVFVFVQSSGQEHTSMAWWDRRFPRNRELECIRDGQRIFAVEEGMPFIFASVTARFASSGWDRYVFGKLNWVVICCNMYFVSPMQQSCSGSDVFSVYSYYRETGVCVCVCHGHYGFDFSSQIKQHLHCTFRFHLRRCFKSPSVKQYGLIRLVWGISVQRESESQCTDYSVLWGGGIFKSNI